MYWTERDIHNGAIGTISSANVDGTNLQVLVSNVFNPVSVAIDQATGKLYWTEFVQNNAIRRANLDGSSPQTLVTGLSQPAIDLAIDSTGGELYWGQSNVMARSDLDGSNVEDLGFPLGTSGGTGVNFPWGIGLDTAAGKIYWADGNTNNIQRANIDGTSIELIIPVSSFDISLDVPNGKIYFLDDLGIGRANLDGSAVENTIDLSNTNFGIRKFTFDALSASFYWTDPGNGSVVRSNMDGTNIETVASGLQDPFNIAVVSSVVTPIPEPTTLAIWSILGGIGLVVGHRRRRNAA